MEYEASSEQLWAVFFTAQLIEMQSKHPVLEQVDLVIEGGVGYGKALRRVIADVFPSALYVGVDLASWQSESIKTTLPDQMLESIIGANPPLLLANCFDYHLVKDICQKTSRVNPILIAVNADGALTSYLQPAPTLKLRRRVVAEHFPGELEELYAGETLNRAAGV